MKGLKFRLSKKFLFIFMGSVVVLGGGSGAAAVFMGTEKVRGPSYLDINGLKCTVVETVKIKKDRRYWVRKYVISDEPGDGVARIKTALRVARAVQEKEKADLVQVAMLDKAGPKDRARMRGRSIGAQVIYIPDTSKAPEGINASTYSAYYVDGSAAADGEYYGMRIDLPLEDAEAMTASLTDKADCVETASAVPADGHAAPAKGHDEKPKSAGHGEAPKGGHEEAPAAASHDAPAPEHGGEAEAATAAKESGGFLDYVKAMIFGGAKDAEPEHDEASVAPQASEPAPEPRTSAEGGKRWSASTDADAKHEEEAAEAAPAPTDGSTAADAAGAAWLAKMRGEGK